MKDYRLMNIFLVSQQNSSISKVSILPYQQKKIRYFSSSSTQIKLKNIFSVGMSVWYITSGIKYLIFHMLFEAFHITSRTAYHFS